MPYFDDQDLDKQQQQSANPGQVAISGASPTTDASGSTSGQAQNGQQKDLNTGSGYQNLDKYLDANSGQQFGQQVVGKVQGEVDSAKQGMADASQKFQTQVQSANTLPTSDQINSAIANPTSADKDQFQSWEKNTYTGPNSLSDSKDAWSQYWSGANKADTSTQLLGTEPGRFTLLDSYFGKPTYNFGQKSLDNLLVQQGGVGEQANDLQSQAAQLKGTGAAQEQQLAGYAANRAGEVEKSRNDTLSAIGINPDGTVITGDKAGAIGQQYKAVDQAVIDQNAQRLQQVAGVRSDLMGGNLTPQELAAIGVTPGENIYNMDLTKYLTPGQDLTKDQVMTPEQRSYIQALSQLAGVTDTYASGTAVDKTNPYSFIGDAFAQDQKSAESSYNSAIEQAYEQAVKQSVGYDFNAHPEALAGSVAMLKQLEKNGDTQDPGLQKEVQTVKDLKNKVDATYRSGRRVGDVINRGAPI